MNSRTFLTVAGCGVFTLIMASLHVVRRDLSPLQRGMSRYAGGNTLALTTIAFFALAGALLSLAADLRRPEPQTARWLVAAAAGLVPVALTPIGNPSPSRLIATLHVAGGLAFYVSTARSMLLTASDPVDRWLSTALAVALFMFLLGGARVPGLRPVTGLIQRIVFSIAIVWALRTASR